MLYATLGARGYSAIITAWQLVASIRGTCCAVGLSPKKALTPGMAVFPGAMGPPGAEGLCVTPGPEPTLLVAVQSEVLSYGLRSGREEVLLATDKERIVFSLDYDPAERKVFWMDLATESICWQGLDSGKKGTLVKGRL